MDRAIDSSQADEAPELWADPGRRHAALAMSAGYIAIMVGLGLILRIVIASPPTPPAAQQPGRVFLGMFALAVLSYITAFKLRDRVLGRPAPRRLPHEDDDSQVQARVFAADMTAWAFIEAIPVLGFVSYLASPDLRQFSLFGVVYFFGVVRVMPVRSRWDRWAAEVRAASAPATKPAPGDAATAPVPAKAPAPAPSPPAPAPPFTGARDEWDGR